jgi:hypothetical protein
MASVDRMIDECEIEKDLERNDVVLIETVFRHLSGGNKERYEKPHSRHSGLGGDSNRSSRVYKSTTLTLNQPVQCPFLIYYGLFESC